MEGASAVARFGAGHLTSNPCASKAFDAPGGVPMRIAAWLANADKDEDMEPWAEPMRECPWGHSEPCSVTKRLLDPGRRGGRKLPDKLPELPVVDAAPNDP